MGEITMIYYKKYFLMDNDDIIESKIFNTDEFDILENNISTFSNTFKSKGIYDVIIYKEETDRSMHYDGNLRYESIQTQNLVGVVIMESDDHDELDLYRRLNGYRTE